MELKLVKAIGRWWRRNQRALDMKILWPQCVAHGGKRYRIGNWGDSPYSALDLAKACFMVHAAQDTAWTRDLTHEELKDFVDRLRPGDRRAP